MSLKFGINTSLLQNARSYFERGIICANIRVSKNSCYRDWKNTSFRMEGVSLKATTLGAVSSPRSKKELGAVSSPRSGRVPCHDTDEANREVSSHEDDDLTVVSTDEVNSVHHDTDEVNIVQNCVPCDWTGVSESVSTLSNSTTSASSSNDAMLLGRCVQGLIDEEIESNKAWKGELLLDVVLDCAIKPMRVNILNYIGVKESLHTIRFCSKTFPVDPCFRNDSWKKLKHYIERSAHSCGYNLASNGPFGSKKNTRQFVCQSGRVHRCKKQPTSKPCSMSYREDVEMNSKKVCRRKDGQSLPRRRLLKRAMSHSGSCKFRLVVYADEISYGIRVICGNPYHNGHLNMKNKGSLLPLRLLTKKERNKLVESFDDDLLSAHSRNTLFNKTGVFLRTQTVSYIRGVEIGRIDDISQSTSDRVIEYLSEQGHDYIYLCHRDVSSLKMAHLNRGVPSLAGNECSALYCALNRTSCDKVTEHSISSDKEREMLLYAESHRKAYMLTDDQHLFMGVAWVIIEERLLFDLCPEVIFVDCTMNTNKDKCPLFTVTGKNRMGNMFTVIRAFLPNQKAWVFRWLFSVVFPSFLSKRTLGRVRIVISDGDSSEYTQIDAAMKKVMPNARRLRCGWHIVNRGWKKHCSNAIHKKMTPSEKRKYHKSIRLVKEWLYSWMRPGYCVDRFEYQVSKYLLYEYLCSATEVLGEINVQRIHNFIMEHVEPHEAHYCFFLRKAVRHYGLYSNCGTEALFNGMKSCASKVTPQCTIPKAVSALCRQADRSVALSRGKVCNEASGSKTWSSFAFLDKILVKSTAMFKRQWDERTNYDSIKVREHQWLVIRTKDRKPSLIPQFYRTYVVNCDHGFFTCSCKHFELNGFACRHLLKVLTSCSDYTEPTHHDFSVAHWKEYHLRSSTISSSDTLQDKFMYLQDHDVIGPYHDPNSVRKDAVVDIMPVEYEKGHKFCCINYSFGNVNYLGNFGHVYGCHARKHVTSNLTKSFEKNFEADNVDCDSDRQDTNISLYERLNPVFQELLQSLETRENSDVVNGVEEYLNSKIIECKTNNVKKFKKRLVGKFVSCNLPTEKRLKTHGTKHFT